MHAFDAMTPVEETLAAARRPRPQREGAPHRLLQLLGLAPDEVAGQPRRRLGLARYVAHQAYYSLIGREYEWELMPLALDQGVGTVVWSPLGWGRLTGKFRRGTRRPRSAAFR
jgi:aryl-alcohol dehydrogenase-like predicted oxidoreductase